MYIRENELHSCEQYNTLIYKNHKILYWGFIFLKGKKCGDETIKFLIDEFTQTKLLPFKSLYGAYRIVIIDDKGKIWFWSDNSNMFTWFKRGKEISDNFLEILHNDENYDPIALAEWFSLGSCYFSKTLYSDITTTNNYFYYSIEEDGIKEYNKKIGVLGDKSDIQNPQEFFVDFAYAIQDLKVCSAITGGYDSRMVVTILNRYKKQDLFISGSDLKSKEICVAQKVAERLNIKLNIINPSLPENLSAYIQEGFERSQGIVPFANSSFVRVCGYFDELNNMNYDLVITGNAGDMHKSWWYTQDWPFYYRKKTNFKKFYRLRIEKISYRKFLGSRLKYNAMKENYMDKLHKELKSINSKSYDAYGFNVNWAKGATANNVFCSMPYYAPLQEFELVKYSYNLPLKEKCFNMFQRKMITEYNDEIAAIPTCYGMTASSKSKYLIRDCFFVILDMIKKVARLFTRKIIKKSVFMNNVETVLLEDELYHNDIVQKAIQYCLEGDIIKNSDEYPSWIWERCLLYYLLESFRGRVKSNSTNKEGKL